MSLAACEDDDFVSFGAGNFVLDAAGATAAGATAAGWDSVTATGAGVGDSEQQKPLCHNNQNH